MGVPHWGETFQGTFKCRIGSGEEGAVRGSGGMSLACQLSEVGLLHVQVNLAVGDALGGTAAADGIVELGGWTGGERGGGSGWSRD